MVHPFVDSIQKQYQRKTLLHKHPDTLPNFELKTIKAVQSIGGKCNEGFRDWFEALEYMKAEIDKTDYDICILGCGAYGFPLAAHVKRMGKKPYIWEEQHKCCLELEENVGKKNMENS